MVLQKKGIRRAAATLTKEEFDELEAEVFLFGWGGCDDETWARLTKRQRKILEDHRCDPRIKPKKQSEALVTGREP